MKKDFVTYEQALELKELGFDETCFGYYNNKKELKFNTNSNPVAKDYIWVGNEIIPTDMILAPLYQQAFRWFRETHNVLANVYSNASGFLFEYHDTIGGTHRYDSNTTGPNDAGCWDTYEEAELECLKKLIEIVKSK